MALSETTAIVLRTYNLADADKIVVCLTQKFGVIRAAARGARRIKSRFGAGLEPFTIAAITYYQREGKELASLKEAEIIQSFFDLAGHAELVTALAYMGELVMEFAPPHEPNEKMFRMVRAVLEALSRSPERVHLLLRYFEVWILKLSGFLPDLKRCSICELKINKEIEVYLDFDLRVLCKTCNFSNKDIKNHDIYISLLSILRLSPESFSNYKGLNKEQLNKLKDIAQNLIRRILEKQIQSSEFVGKL